LAQDWIATNCSEFIGKDEWAPNSPDVNPLDCHACRGVVLEHYKTSLAVNMEPAAAGLNQQGRTELHKNASSLCERLNGHLERALRKTVERR